MFLVREIDKILETVVSLSRDKKRSTKKLHISLADAERINVENLQLATKIRYPFGLSSNVILGEMFKTTGLDDLNKLIPRNKQKTTDGLFASLMIPLIVSKLTQTQNNYYPYSKLIICDRTSYDLLLKLQRALFVPDSSKLRNIFYKAPFDVTAIFLLDDLIDLLDREGEPVYYLKYEPTLKRYSANYNYPFVRKAIPFLKISDLVIILHDKKNIELGNFDMNSSREHQLIQLFGHFARTSELVELKSITKIIGIPHLSFNNVLKIQPLSDSTESDKNIRLGYSRPSLSHLSSMSEILIQLAERLSLNLVSISYRANDTHNQTKVLTEFVIMALNSSKTSRTVNDLTARVLVVDRFHDLRGPLLHADKYGAFLDQEKQSKTVSESSLQLRFDTIDELDEKLQLDQLTEVLSSILKYSISLRPKESFNSGQSELLSPTRYSQPSLTTSQSICRHLDRVKAVYKCLCEGYLLIVRLESNLESIAQEIRCSKEPLTNEEQSLLVDRVQRAVSALKQLIKISGKSIGVYDMMRVACILDDVVNLFLHHLKTGDQSSSNKSVKSLNEIKSNFLRSKELKKLLKPILEVNEEESVNSSKLIKSLDSFDKISLENCQHTSVTSLEQVVDKFCSSELGEDASYTTISLTKDLNQRNLGGKKEIIILAFLGSLSFNELSRLKYLGKSIKKKHLISDIIVLVCDILKPEDFLNAL